MFQTLDLPVVFSDTGLEFIQSKDNFESLFVIDNFTSDAFQKLHKSHCKIVGPAVIISCAHTSEVSSSNIHKFVLDLQLCYLQTLILLCYCL